MCSMTGLCMYIVQKYMQCSSLKTHSYGIKCDRISLISTFYTYGVIMPQNTSSCNSNSELPVMMMETYFSLHVHLYFMPRNPFLRENWTNI
jgi:hypothetical protein